MVTSLPRRSAVTRVRGQAVSLSVEVRTDEGGQERTEMRRRGPSLVSKREGQQFVKARPVHKDIHLLWRI